MDKIDLLIGKFKEFKEELNKNQNMSYGGEANNVNMSEAIKFEKNGQWKLDKSVYNAGTHPPKGYVPGKKQAVGEHAEYDPKYSFKENRELVRMHRQDTKQSVNDDAHLDALTRAAAKRGGHKIAA